MNFRFCSTRWIEDESVASRAIQIWESIVKVIKQVLSASKRPKQNKSYEALVKHYLDRVMLAKFHFFKFVASIFKNYLTSFQTDNPMLPFLSVEKIMRRLMNMFVKKEVLEEANTAYKLIKLDVSKKENLSAPQLVDCGTATKHFLKSNNLPADQKLQFKKSCVAMLVSIVQKLQEKYPLNHTIVRNSRSLSPIVMSTEPKVCALQFSALVDKLFATKWISERVAENAKLQMQEFLFSKSKTKFKNFKSKFKNFDVHTQRLDDFLGVYLHKNEKYSSLWKICQIVFVLSHGQSSVECGFSVNKKLLVENLGEISLVSQGRTTSLL